MAAIGTKITPEEAINWFTNQDSNNKYLTIPEDIYLSIDNQTAHQIAELFNGKFLIKFPEREIKFFEWLKKEDISVWNDLWANSEEDLYFASISFLPVLIDKSIGFPICDLLDNDNYFFTPEHIDGAEAKMFVDSIMERFMRRDSLTLGQSLLLNISAMPTDIWHFAYNNNVALEKVKLAVQELIDENLILHLTEAEHLAGFIKF